MQQARYTTFPSNVTQHAPGNVTCIHHVSRWFTRSPDSTHPWRAARLRRLLPLDPAPNPPHVCSAPAHDTSVSFCLEPSNRLSSSSLGIVWPTQHLHAAPSPWPHFETFGCDQMNKCFESVCYKRCERAQQKAWRNPGRAATLLRREGIPGVRPRFWGVKESRACGHAFEAWRNPGRAATLLHRTAG